MGTSIRSIISLRVRELRLQRGMSVDELAKAASVSPSYIYAIESCKRGSRVEELYRISQALGVCICVLLKELEE